MALVILNVEVIDSNTIVVEFSDESFATFTAAELTAARRYRDTPDIMVAPPLLN